MTVVSVMFLFWAGLVFVPCCVLAVQVLAALLPAKRASGKGDALRAAGDAPEVCLLMPAHNEATGIGKVLQLLQPQLNSSTRLLVVADNCTDTTAAIVRAFAVACPFVEVIERHETQLRGKGYALDHGVRHLERNPPNVVVVVDADCELTPNCVGSLARQCESSRQPVQALYLMASPEGAGIKLRVAEFAWLVKNKVRPLGYHRMGLPCQLMGTGMAFTWQQISRAQLSTGHIVEDMQLGVDLALAGTPPVFCPDTLVTSVFPASADGLATQRTRWEHGHLGVIVSQVPSLLWRGFRDRNLALFAMALDLCVPPLALLFLLTVSTLLACLAWVWVGGSALPVWVSLTGGAMLGLALFAAWYGFGQGVISFWQLCQVPAYAVKKIPLYFYFLAKRQSSWVRSKRDGEQ